MPAMHVRIRPGRYRAVTPVVVTVMHHGQEVEYRLVHPGATFRVPERVNGYWDAATYHPDFGDRKPQFEPITPETEDR